MYDVQFICMRAMKGDRRGKDDLQEENVVARNFVIVETRV